MLTKLKNALLRGCCPFAQFNAKIPRHISDHLAQDIGMSRSEIERHRFVWPSQSPDRPLF